MKPTSFSLKLFYPVVSCPYRLGPIPKLQGTLTTPADGYNTWPPLFLTQAPVTADGNQTFTNRK
jgi:hypothetical protein